MPEFDLPDPYSTVWSSATVAGKPVVVVFMCNHCPFVKHIAGGLADRARDYERLGVAVVGINANDVNSHSADSPENMKLFIREYGIDFPYLSDESQASAISFRAACTPDFFLFDADHKLVYRGQFDSARPSNQIPVTGEDLTAAVEAVVSGRTVAGRQVPSIGCNIKWKPGNAPGYSQTP
jgi:peroxiredoxin